MFSSNWALNAQKNPNFLDVDLQDYSTYLPLMITLLACLLVSNAKIAHNRLKNYTAAANEKIRRSPTIMLISWIKLSKKLSISRDYGGACSIPTR